jgi:hypothetical protein
MDVVPPEMGKECLPILRVFSPKSLGCEEDKRQGRGYAPIAKRLRTERRFLLHSRSFKWHGHGYAPVVRRLKARQALFLCPRLVSIPNPSSDYALMALSLCKLRDVGFGLNLRSCMVPETILLTMPLSLNRLRDVGFGLVRRVG